MAGLGRRTHYRKHLTDAVLFDLPEPASNERIGKIIATRGGNQFDVRIATTATTTNTTSTTIANAMDQDQCVLAILPTKFRKLVWLKRNDYVIAQTVEDFVQEDDEEGTQNDMNKVVNLTKEGEGIRYMITHILYKDQIQHLVANGLWPCHDPNFVEPDASAILPELPDVVQDDGIVYQQDYNENFDDEVDNDTDDDGNAALFVNTNRIGKVALEDSSSEEDNNSDN